MPRREFVINRKGMVTVECDKCKKQSFMKRKNINDEMWRDLTNNWGVLCADCERKNQSTEPRISYLIGSFYTVYPDIVKFEHLQGVKRAKEVLKRGEDGWRK